jgi:transposase-like protein
VKELTKAPVEGMLSGELNHHLGYGKPQRIRLLPGARLCH